MRDRLTEPADAPPADEIEAVIQALTREGALSDPRYCEAWTNARRRRGYGPLRIVNELVERGIAREMAVDIVDPDDPAWGAAAIRLRARHFGDAIPHAWPDKARQMKFLMTRGYTQEQIGPALSGVGQD